MYDKLIILSDIHANLSALNAVTDDFERQGLRPDGIVILGDIINYGMRPNEVIAAIKRLPYPIAVNIFGNHEKAVVDGDLTKFSTDRGRRMLEYTSKILTEESREFIVNDMNHDGYDIRQWHGKRILFVHGAAADPYWGSIKPHDISSDSYAQYDIVISGHSHIPHHAEYFYPADNPAMRNKRRAVFINPGSVGQPRNHNPRAQYVYMELSSGIVHFNSAEYDIETEQRLFPDCLDAFYKQRLTSGI